MADEEVEPEEDSFEQLPLKRKRRGKSKSTLLPGEEPKAVKKKKERPKCQCWRMRNGDIINAGCPIHS